MACTITVVGRVGDGDRWLVPLVRSLDAQTLPYDAFEVVFLTPGADHPLGPRLRTLAGRRPNVRVVDADAAADASDIAVGDWLLDLGTQLELTRPVLFPQALERLVAYGESGRHGIVLGRTVRSKSDIVNDLYVSNRTDIAPDQGAGGAGLAMRRREPVAEFGRAAVFADYPVAQVGGALPAPAATTSQATLAAYSWSDGRLVAEVSGTVTGAPSDARVRFSIRLPSSGLEYWLAGDGEVRGTEFSGRVALDIRAAALGRALDHGVWELRVGVHGAAPRWSSRAALPVGAVSGATIDGLLVSVGAEDGTLLVDVGATRFSPVGKVSPAAVTVRESSRGSLMTMSLDLATVGQTRQRGTVRLGGFNLPGYLLSDQNGSRVECYLSGLPGDLAMSTRFGTARAQSTALTVSVSSIGHFSFSKRPPGSARRPASRAQRLRRQVPGPLEPLARALSGNPTARRIYRKFAGLDQRANRT